MLTYSAREHLQLLSKIEGRETDAGSNGFISQCRTDILQIRLHISKIELGSQHQISLMEATLIPALKDVQASLKQLTTSREIESDDEIRKVLEAIGGETLDRPSTFPTVVLQTSTYRTKQCTVPRCACQCHAVSKLQHPRWIAPLIGSLFIGYSRLPYLCTAGCNESTCTKREDALIKATYYFPTWASYFSRMLSFVGKWNQLDGHDFSLRMPRVVPSSSDIFMLAQKGNVQGIKMLFSLSKASNYTIEKLASPLNLKLMKISP